MPANRRSGGEPAAGVSCVAAAPPPLRWQRARADGAAPPGLFDERRRPRLHGSRRRGRRRDRMHAVAPRPHRLPVLHTRVPSGQREMASRRSSERATRLHGRSRRRSGTRNRRRWRRGGRRRAADRIGHRSRLRRWLRPRPGRRRRVLRRQEGQRIEIALRVVGESHPEVDVRHRQLGLAARADRADELPLRDGVAAPDDVRPEVNERHRIAVGSRDRHRLAADRHRPRERDRARDGSNHRCPGGRADVDPTMLSGGIWVRAVEREEREHRALHGPAPAEGGRGNDQHRCGYHCR